MRAHVVFIGLGLVFLVVGMGFGMWMGMTQSFQFAAVHAHWNLVGWVTSTLYGLIHRAYPKLSESKLTWPQCIVHVTGVLVFSVGIFLALTVHTEIFAVVGALLTLAAALMFMWIYYTHDHRIAPD